VGDNGFWMLLSPFDLHPDCREAVWSLIEARRAHLDRQRYGRWRHACFPTSSGGRAG